MYKFKAEIPSYSYWQRLVRCQDACPVHTDVRGYVQAIAQGEYEKAYAIARAPNPLASICGRICAAPCEVSCRRASIDEAVAIRVLKRFVCERHGVETRPLFPESTLVRAVNCLVPHETNSHIDNVQVLLEAFKRPLFHPASDSLLKGHRVAIIGSGPAGLACAHDLALMGCSPVIFEMEPVAGGVLALGIPAYRLPKDLIAAEIDVIRKLGVHIECSTTVGKDITFLELTNAYAAVVIAVGAKHSRGLPLRNSTADGVIGGVEFLKSVHLRDPYPLGRRVIVIGGGNVAYDVARTVLRQEEYDVARSALRMKGVEEVHLCCLEALEEMPADAVEIIEGEQEGVIRHNAVGPHEIHVDDRGRVCGVTFKKVLRVYDSSGRFDPVYDYSDLHYMPCDTLILSVGQRTDFGFIAPETDGVQIKPDGSIDYDPETLRVRGTRNAFVAGDCAHGTKFMIDAIASGKKAARNICTFLAGVTITPEVLHVHLPLKVWTREEGYETRPRQAIPCTDLAVRKGSLSAPVELPLSVPQASYEASRCLDCAVNPIFDSEKCILCGGCADVCPELCLKLVPLAEVELEGNPEFLQGETKEEQMTVIIKDEDRCIRCGLCAERCPNGAITMEHFTFTTHLTVETRERPYDERTGEDTP